MQFDREKQNNNENKEEIEVYIYIYKKKKKKKKKERETEEIKKMFIIYKNIELSLTTITTNMGTQGYERVRVNCSVLPRGAMPDRVRLRHPPWGTSLLLMWSTRA